MLIMVVIAGSGLDGDNPAITVGENVIAVDLAPFVALGRTTQVILAVVYFIPAIPVFVLDFGAFFHSSWWRYVPLSWRSCDCA
jgi:hypothetical protein